MWYQRFIIWVKSLQSLNLLRLKWQYQLQIFKQCWKILKVNQVSQFIWSIYFETPVSIPARAKDAKESECILNYSEEEKLKSKMWYWNQHFFHSKAERNGRLNTVESKYYNFTRLDLWKGQVYLTLTKKSLF